MPSNKEQFSLTAEIFAVGKWNGIDVSLQMLHDMVSNFSALADIIDVPLKFGHNEEQPMTDGQPALGWINRIWVEGSKLLGHFTDIPKLVYEAMESKRYKNVSIEALFDVKHKGHDYGTVLTAVALLGVDRPAVNTLSDLQTYMTSKNVEFTSHATFSKLPIKEVPTMGMTPEEQAEFNALKAANKALTDANATNAAKVVEFSTSQTQLQSELAALKKSSEEAEFSVAKKTLTDDLESLVKSSVIAPATRDDLLKDLTKDSLEQLKFTVATMKKIKPAGETGEGDMGKSKGDSNSDLSAGDRVSMKASEMKAKNPNLTFSAAVQEVFKIDPELAKEYAHENDGGEQ